jgi:hypothetical protein
MPTGAASGFDVVDLDGEEGIAEWTKLEAKHGKAPTYSVRTPRGGLHLYYRHDPARPIPCTASKLAPHIDTRGDGGYVLVPPSIVGGKSYE